LLCLFVSLAVAVAVTGAVFFAIAIFVAFLAEDT